MRRKRPVENKPRTIKKTVTGSWKWKLVTQSCPTLCDPMDHSPPGSSVHGILQARVLEWVATSFSRGSSWPRDQTRVSWIAGGFFTIWATGSYILIITWNENGLMHQAKDIDWLGGWKHVHVCTFTYHITLLDPPPNCM